MGLDKISPDLLIKSLDSLKIMILIIDNNGIIIEFNEACRKYCKRPKDKIFNKHIWDVILKNTRKPEDCIIDKVQLTKKKESREILVNNKWLKINVDPVFIGNEIKNIIVTIEEITEKRNNLIKLEERESKYKNLIELANIAIAQDDENGNIIYCNLQFADLFGYKIEEILKLSHSDLVHPDDRDRVSKIHYDRMLNSKMSNNFEFKGIKKNGDVVYISISVSDIIKEGNKIIGTVSYLFDITKRVKANEKIKRLAHTVESISEFVSITDYNNNFIYVNKAFLNKYGFMLSEVIGKNPDLLRTDYSSTDLTNTIQQKTLSGEWKGEVWNKKKDGTIFPIELTTSTIYDENSNPIALVGIARDISERKKNEKIQRVLFNISQASSNIIELDEFIKFIKKELSQIIDTINFYFAYYDEEKDEFFSPYMSDEKDNFMRWSAGKSLSAYVVRNRKSVLFSEKVVKKLIKQNEIEIVGTPSKIWLGTPVIVDGKVIGLFAVQDYNNKNAYTKDDLKILDYIAIHVSRLIERKMYYDKIEKALKQAQESDQLKTAFITNLSHEVRTPLNGLLGFVKLILDPKIDFKKRYHYASIIDISAKQLTMIIEDILQISRLETNQIRIYKESFKLKRLITDTCSDLLSAFNIKHLEFKYDFSPINEAFIINSDKNKIEKILQYLLDNAIKFTEKGIVKCSCKKESELIKFIIEDTGIGIDSDNFVKIFKSFSQVEMDVTRKYGGNGLGLAIAKGFVEKLGGEIWVESKIGEGSVFYFTIPI